MEGTLGLDATPAVAKTLRPARVEDVGKLFGMFHSWNGLARQVWCGRLGLSFGDVGLATLVALQVRVVLSQDEARARGRVGLSRWEES